MVSFLCFSAHSALGTLCRGLPISASFPENMRSAWQVYGVVYLELYLTDDGGWSNGGQNTSLRHNFTIEVADSYLDLEYAVDDPGANVSNTSFILSFRRKVAAALGVPLYRVIYTAPEVGPASANRRLMSAGNSIRFRILMTSISDVPLLEAAAATVPNASLTTANAAVRNLGRNASFELASATYTILGLHYAVESPYRLATFGTMSLPQGTPVMPEGYEKVKACTQ